LSYKFAVASIRRIHPELEEHRRLIDEKRQVVSKLTGTMLHALAGGIERVIAETGTKSIMVLTPVRKTELLWLNGSAGGTS